MEEERKDLQENTSEDSDMVKEQESCAEQEAQENAEQEAAEEVPAEEDSAEETAVQEPSQEDPAQDEEECSGKEGKADKKLFKKKKNVDSKIITE